MCKGKLFLVAGILCVFNTHVLKVSAQVKTELGYKPGELLVRFAPKDQGRQITGLEKHSILNSLGGATVEHNYRIVPGLSLIKLPENMKVEDVLSAYNANEGILYAEPNYRTIAFGTIPDDTNFSQQWGLHNVGQVAGKYDADIDAPEAWAIRTEADPNIIVAVIDTGVDYTHPDLAGNMWINEAEYNGDPNYDDDGNGYKDDIYGYDFCTTQYGEVRDSDPYDNSYFSHGTLCAGIIGAIGNNDEGIAGVCWKVKIMAVKHLNSEGNGIISDAIAAVEYAVANGAKILSNSWGMFTIEQEKIDSLQDSVEAAEAAGALWVAASGNKHTAPVYPSRFENDNIISVMASDPCDWLWIVLQGYEGSNYSAEFVDLAAPGEGIYSTIVGGGYSSQSGTSMACPMVAGACALLWSEWGGLNLYQVKKYMMDSVDRPDTFWTIYQLEGKCVSGGRLNLFRALTEVGDLRVSMVDDIDPNYPVGPGDEVVYTIAAWNPAAAAGDLDYVGTFTDVEVVCTLPDAVAE